MSKQSDKQYLFDKSLAHIRKQGGPSIDADSKTCMYRNGTLKCAAGPFIKTYSAKMERKDWTTLVDIGFRSELDARAFKHASFVGDLQRCHDEAAFWCDGDLFMSKYEDAMRNLAACDWLVYTPRDCQAA